MLVEFGDPVPILQGDLFEDYTESALIDGYYEPPISPNGLIKSFRSNAMHSSAIFAKRNIVSAYIDLHPTLSRLVFDRFLLEDLMLGNGYLLKVSNRLNSIVRFDHLPSKFIRRREKADSYSYKTFSQDIDYKTGVVFHALEYDPSQEIYGIPQYFAALSSIWLNEDATLFRRKYYKNGAHSGFLLYMNNPNLTDKQEESIVAQLNSAKGLGNFKNMFINGKGKDGEKPELIPVGQINAKDEFANIKNVSTGDILAAHRIPLDLMSIVRDGFTASSDLNKVDKMFYKNEVIPIFNRLTSLNDWAGFEVIKLKEYSDLDPQQ